MFNFIERHGGRTIFKWGYCLLASLLIVLVTVYGMFAVHHPFGDEQLRLTRVGRASAIMADPDALFAQVRVDKTIVVMVDRNGHEARLEGSPDMHAYRTANTLTYLNRTIQCTVDWEDSWDYMYTFSDGTSATEPFAQIVFADGDYHELRDRLSPLQREEYDLYCKMEEYLTDGNPIWRCIGLGLLALLLLLGMASLCFPEAFWKLDTMFTVRGGEPTDWAIFSNRVGGVLLILVSFVIPFLPV